MKSTIIELEKKIENILEELDSLEVDKSPLSKSFDSFLEFARNKLLDRKLDEDLKLNEVLQFYKEFKNSQFRYDMDMECRINEWNRITEERFSRLLGEELSIPQGDICIIKKPFYMLLRKMGLMQEFPEILSEFNLKFLIRYKDGKLSLGKFLRRLENSKCVDLSELYDASIASFIKLTSLQVETASIEVINKKIVEEVFIPAKKLQDGYIDEEKAKEELKSSIKEQENYCTMRMAKGKNFLVRNIADIDEIYSEIKKEYSCLAEYIEKDLGLGSMPFLHR